MKNFTLISKKYHSPSILFNCEEGILEISGKLMGNNKLQYFDALNAHICNYIEMPQDVTLIKINIEAITTSETKHLLDMFNLFRKLEKKKKTVKVEWLYEQEDEDMLEMAENYQYFTKLPFEIKEIETI